MQLLVSVSDVSEARAALEGGADIIDAKDPHSGALGPVAPVVLEGIARAVGDQRTITAALGDVDDSGLVGQLASTAARSGARFVKIGVGLVSDPLRASHLVAAASRACANGPEPTRLVAVTYADAPTGVGLDPIALVAIASRAGAHGVLVDTSIKDGPGLSALWTRQQIRSWVAAAHSDGMIAAVAGRLGVKDLSIAFDVGADIAGVRGAACVGGRTGRVDVARVRMLRQEIDRLNATRPGASVSAGTIETVTVGASADAK